MEKPRTERETIQYFIDGKITEAEFFAKRSYKHDWPELEILKKETELFSKFLLKFSIDGRINILLKDQILGMPHDSLYTKYGISKNKIRVLKGQLEVEKSKAKPKIRYIKHTQSISNELYANLAIFARVPVSWFKKKDPELKWTVEHFNDLSNALLTPAEFKEYLFKTEKDAQKYPNQNNKRLYDIRGIILNISNSHNIYIRVGIFESGGFIVEVFSEQYEFFDYAHLKRILAQFEPIQTGYVETVIKGRKNPIIICKSLANNVPSGINLKNY